ncbi:hypothetical protein BDP81DRAFT_507301 [Colletotrichum phormii]|uniref:Uncharacterized protein n=1 Tax=Colletotrichum phormii TaxID=359342 RepID=A0AAI9ZG02_9PEZI|nr:uncharacterized protein BDP81DRAFT_507301 [Colletotrichum phormii]KAK1622689.1 hypothetical protein BDP81DRAFT_507301 [Colletotrichum phormii]
MIFDDDDDESLFGSPLNSPQPQPYFAVRDPTHLCLPGMSSSHLPNANLAPAQAQSTTSKLQVPQVPQQVMGTEGNALDVPTRPQTPEQRRLSRNNSKPSSSRTASTTQRAPISTINPGVPVRLIPTMPGSSALASETPLFAPPIAPGYSVLPPLPASLLLPPTPPVLNEDRAPSASGEASPAQKMCSKCRKVKPQSEYTSMTHMGLIKERSQCEPCRRKRRESSARHKLRKGQAETEAEDTQEQAQQQQLPQGGMSQCPHHGLDDNQLTLSSHPLASIAGSGQATQSSPMRGVATKSTMLGFSSITQPMREASTLFYMIMVAPNALITTQHDPIDLTFPTVPSFFDWPGAHELAQGIDLEADMAFYGLQSSKRLLSPSSVFPKETGMEVGVSQIQDTTSAFYDIVSVKTLKTPLTKNEENWLLNHERQKFKEARHKCPWMKTQDKTTLELYWEKRQASIVLGLVDVPGSDLQPMIGYSYAEGSHQSLAGAYPDDYDWH